MRVRRTTTNEVYVSDNVFVADRQIKIIASEFLAPSLKHQLRSSIKQNPESKSGYLPSNQKKAGKRTYLLTY